MTYRNNQDMPPVVPQEHRWLESMHAIMRRGNMPVTEAVLAGGELRLTFETEPELLRVIITPKREDRPGWASTGFFTIGFEGSGELGPAPEKVLRLLVKVLERYEPYMPRDLEGFASMGLRMTVPDETLPRMFPFITLERSEQGGTRVVEVLIRTTPKCNQRCPFCAGPTHGLPSREILETCFQVIGEAIPGAMVSLTGGEPTLRPTFLEELAAAIAVPGISHVQVQTNGVNFAARVDPAALPQTPKLTFFVSLHALEPDIYDRCTGTRGQLPLALDGLKRILAAGHPVVVNTVVNSANVNHLEEMYTRLPELFPGENSPTLHFSVLICPEWRPEAAEYLLRYRDLVPVLDRISERARSRGMDVQSLLSSTHASMPPCVVPEEHRNMSRHIPSIQVHETGYEDYSKLWVKAASCRNCREDSRCLGVPGAYARRFGLEELQPI